MISANWTEFKGVHGRGGNSVTSPGSDPWDGENCLGKRPAMATSRCSYISKAEILIDCFTSTKKRAGNAILLLNYGLLGLFLNVINDTSLLQARDIHQQNRVPSAQVLREFQDITTQSSTVSMRVWNDKSPKNRNHYSLEIGINWCVFSEMCFPLKLWGFHKHVRAGHVAAEVNMNTGKARWWEIIQIETFSSAECDTTGK